MNSSNYGPGVGNSTISTDWTDRTLFPEYQAEEIMVKIFAPCILAAGAFGNIATICVMRRIKDRNSSQHAILTALAVSDYLLIQTGMLYRLLLYYFHIDMAIWHWLVCKLYYYLAFTTGMLSAWLVTCVTVQRAMCITWPHKMSAVCTLRRTWIVVSSLAITTCIINIHFFVGMEITSDNACGFGTDEYSSFFVIWMWVDMFLSSLFPSLCQIVCDVVLCLALFKAASTMSETVQSTSTVNAKHDFMYRRKTASRITVMCLALSCTFLILTLPICIEGVWYYFGNVNITPNSKKNQQHAQSEAKQHLTESVLNLLWYINSAVNFFLYCITGTKFRNEFLNWICCRSRSNSTASVSNATARAVKEREPHN